MVNKLGPIPTHTIFDNYKTFKSFLADTTISVEELKTLALHKPYIRGSLRYITMHINCNEEVYSAMKTSSLWFVRSVGYFCWRRSFSRIKSDSLKILTDQKEHRMIINIARKMMRKSEILMSIIEDE